MKQVLDFMPQIPSGRHSGKAKLNRVEEANRAISRHLPVKTRFKHVNWQDHTNGHWKAN